MLLFALDTSTRQAGLALCSEDDLYGEYAWLVGNNHSVELLDRVQRLMAECNLTMSDLDAIAVALLGFIQRRIRGGQEGRERYQAVLRAPLGHAERYLPTSQQAVPRAG